MEYMILIHGEEVATPAPGTPEFDTFMASWLDYNQRLIDGGHWVSGANLLPTASATTLRREFGQEPTITDGPYAETKEQLGGYYLIEAKDLDEAIELAKALPLPVGSLEIRPVNFRPDAARPDAG
jgi:hypothetical protein